MTQSATPNENTLDVDDIESMMREADPTAEQIDDAIEAKIQEAIAEAISAGTLSEDAPILVGITPDGHIHVSNDDASEVSDHNTEVAEDDREQVAPFELPASFFQQKESLADRYQDHFDKNWGF